MVQLDHQWCSLEDICTGEFQEIGTGWFQKIGPGGGGKGGHLHLFEPREFSNILIITETCFLNSQQSQN